LPCRCRHYAAALPPPYQRRFSCFAITLSMPP
jgi:hypothetical protein